MITSNDNKLIKEVNALKQKKYRDLYNCFVIEGEKFISEIPEDITIDKYIVSESFSLNHNLDRYKNRAALYTISDTLFKSLSDTVTPQGILAICMKKEHSIIEILKKEKNFLVVGENLTDPGNLGTIIRTSFSANASGIILSEGSVDIYNPKTVRASAGYLFHIPIIENIDIIKLLFELKSLKVTTVATHVKAAKLPYTIDFTQSVAIIIGNEGNGLSNEVANLADLRVKLPMPGGAESLNASIACGILLYEVVRQRLI